MAKNAPFNSTTRNTLHHLRKAPKDGTADGRVSAAFQALYWWEQNLMVMYIESDYNCSRLAKRMNVNRKSIWLKIHRIKQKLQKSYDHTSD